MERWAIGWGREALPPESQPGGIASLRLPAFFLLAKNDLIKREKTSREKEKRDQKRAEREREREVTMCMLGGREK